MKTQVPLACTEAKIKKTTCRIRHAHLRNEQPDRLEKPVLRVKIIVKLVTRAIALLLIYLSICFNYRFAMNICQVNLS